MHFVKIENPWFDAVSSREPRSTSRNGLDAGRRHDHEVECGRGKIRGPDPAGRGRVVACQCRRRASAAISIFRLKSPSSVVTLRGEDSCRIISARKATRHEQDRYYAGHRETW